MNLNKLLVITIFTLLPTLGFSDELKPGTIKGKPNVAKALFSQFTNLQKMDCVATIILGDKLHQIALALGSHIDSIEVSEVFSSEGKKALSLSVLYDDGRGNLDIKSNPGICGLRED